MLCSREFSFRTVCMLVGTITVIHVKAIQEISIRNTSLKRENNGKNVIFSKILSLGPVAYSNDFNSCFGFSLF